MISVDTNILLYAFNSDCEEHQRAREVIKKLGSDSDVVLSELVLVELYILLRNPVVIGHPLKAAEAVSVCRAWRKNPRWRVVECGPIMEKVWEQASRSDFGRRQIIDARLALTLRHHGVTTFVTRNTGHFENYGFERLWNPFE